MIFKISLTLLLCIIAISSTYCQDDTKIETSLKSTTNFWDSCLSGFSLIFVSEIGDKTFFLAMVYAASNSFLKTLLLTGGTMLTLNAINILIGYAIPLLLYREYIDWIAIAIFFFFGIVQLYQGLTIESKYIDEEYKEVVREIKSITSSMEKEYENISIENKDLKEKILEIKEEEEAVKDYRNPNFLSASAYITSLMIAEIGDKSQITAIVIGAINNLNGVLLGTSLALLACIIIAILFGNFLKSVLTNKELTLIGAVIFLLYSFIFFMEKMKFF